MAGCIIKDGKCVEDTTQDSEQAPINPDSPCGQTTTTSEGEA